MSMNSKKIVILAVIVVAVVAYFQLGLGQYLSLDALKAQQAALGDYYRQHPWQVAGLYLLAYVAVTALSLPGAALMTLAGGAIFGLLWGTVIVSFASSIGATLAFWPRASCSATGSAGASANASRRWMKASGATARSICSRCA
jgi:uncharacterized membrane protein YdjX (TVP38/TMEM64 family)